MTDIRIQGVARCLIVLLALWLAACSSNPPARSSDSGSDGGVSSTPYVSFDDLKDSAPKAEGRELLGVEGELGQGQGPPHA